MRPEPIILDAVRLMQDEITETRQQGGPGAAEHALALEYVVEALLWAVDAEPPLVTTSVGRFLGQSCEEPD